MTRQDYIRGIEATKEALAGDPENPALHNTLGYYFYKIGEYGSAESEYNNAIMYNREFPLPYNNLGILSLLKKDYEQAEKYFSSAIGHNPQYAKAAYNLGVTYFRQKKYIKAVRYYLKAKDIDKEYVKEREDPEKRERELSKALAEDPDNEVLKKMIKRLNEKDDD